MNENEKTSKLADESSILINSAMAEKFLNNPKASMEIYKKAAKKEMETSNAYLEIGSQYYIYHLISGGWCAYHANDVQYMETIITKIDDVYKIKNNKSLLKEIKELNHSLKILKKHFKRSNNVTAIT